MKLMSCDDVQSSLIDYIEFELPMSRRQQFNAHLTHCDQCQEMHDELQSVIVDAKSIEIREPGPQFWQELPNKVLAEVNRQERVKLEHVKHEHVKQEPFQSQHQGELDYATTLDSSIADSVKRAGSLPSENTGYADMSGDMRGDNILPFKALATTPAASGVVDCNDQSETQPVYQRLSSTKIRAKNRTTSASLMSESQCSEQQPSTEPFADKPYSRFTWPKKALPMAASLLVAIGGVLMVNQISVDKVNSVPFDNNAPMFYDSVAVQGEIAAGAAISNQALASLAQTMVPITHQSARFGFTSQNAILNSFSIGALFTETIVYIKSDDETLVKTHLALLGSAMHRQAGSKHLIQGIEALQTQHEIDPDVRANQLSQLMNHYAASLQSIADKEFFLFKLGAWSYDFALAALAKDASLYDKADDINAFKAQLQRLGAPAGVAKSLEEINARITKDVMTEGDYKRTIEEMENIRSLLG